MDRYGDNGMNRMACSAHSPELNPKENITDELDYRTKACDNPQKSVNGRTCLL